MQFIPKFKHKINNVLFVLHAYPIPNLIDPTGAGDTFAGGLMCYFSRENKITVGTAIKAIAYDTIASSFNVEGFGLATTSKLTISKLNIRLNEFRQKLKF